MNSCGHPAENSLLPERKMCQGKGETNFTFRLLHCLFSLSCSLPSPVCLSLSLSLSLSLCLSLSLSLSRSSLSLSHLSFRHYRWIASRFNKHTEHQKCRNVRRALRQ